MDIADIGKMAFIDRLLEKVPGVVSEVLPVRGMEIETLQCHKLFLEGIDFNLVYTPLKHLGYKTVIHCLGHLYAKGSIPRTLSVQIALSRRFSAENTEELWDGMAAAVKEHSIEEVSLDLLPSLTGMTISLSAGGLNSDKKSNGKISASNGDLICLSGNLGAAYMGLQLLEREKALFDKNPAVQPQLDHYKFILRAYLNPELNTSLYELIRNGKVTPVYGEFITKGLGDAVKMSCNATGFGAKIFLDRIPIASQTFEMAEELHIDAITAAINGGEDFRNLYIIPLNQYDDLRKELPQLDVIGHLCSPDAGTKLITPDGNELELKAQGWSK